MFKLANQKAEFAVNQVQLVTSKQATFILLTTSPTVTGQSCSSNHTRNLSKHDSNATAKYQYLKYTIE